VKRPSRLSVRFRGVGSEHEKARSVLKAGEKLKRDSSLSVDRFLQSFCRAKRRLALVLHTAESITRVFFFSSLFLFPVPFFFVARLEGVGH